MYALRSTSSTVTFTIPLDSAPIDSLGPEGVAHSILDGRIRTFSIAISVSDTTLDLFKKIADEVLCPIKSLSIECIWFMNKAFKSWKSKEIDRLLMNCCKQTMGAYLHNLSQDKTFVFSVTILE